MVDRRCFQKGRRQATCGSQDRRNSLKDLCKLSSDFVESMDEMAGESIYIDRSQEAR